MGFKHKILAGMEETRLLRDFNQYGYEPQLYDDCYYWDSELDDHQHHGWIMLSPNDADKILEELWRIRDLEK